MKASELNKAKYWFNTELQDDDTPAGGTAHVRETLIEFLGETFDGKDIDDLTMDEINVALKECGIKPIDYQLAKERADFAVMTALYFGNRAAQIDVKGVRYDYDSFMVINNIIAFATSHDFEMCEDNGNIEIDTEVAREKAFEYADQLARWILE